MGLKSRKNWSMEKTLHQENNNCGWFSKSLRHIVRGWSDSLKKHHFTLVLFLCSSSGVCCWSLSLSWMNSVAVLIDGKHFLQTILAYCCDQYHKHLWELEIRSPFQNSNLKKASSTLPSIIFCFQKHLSSGSCSYAPNVSASPGWAVKSHKPSACQQHNDFWRWLQLSRARSLLKCVKARNLKWRVEAVQGPLELLSPANTSANVSNAKNQPKALCWSAQMIPQACCHLAGQTHPRHPNIVISLPLQPNKKKEKKKKDGKGSEERMHRQPLVWARGEAWFGMEHGVYTAHWVFNRVQEKYLAWRSMYGWEGDGMVMGGAWHM